MLCMRARDTWSNPDPLGDAEILLFNLNLNVNDNNYCKVLAKTHTWNGLERGDGYLFHE